MQIRHSLFAFLLASLAIVPAAAWADSGTRVGNLVELSVLDRDRTSELPILRGRGEAFVEGRPGQRYAVRLSNRSGGRVLVVLSVDGVNAVSGETAAPDQAGYVLEPYQTTEVTGWRKSLSEVAAFNFTSLPDSYAARTGRPDNVGVIGVAVFQELRPLPPPPVIAMEKAREATAGAAETRSDRLARAAPAPAQSLGTAHGQREYSGATRTRFERASSVPAEIIALRYDQRDNLMAMGVIPAPRHRHHRPMAFPGGFVPDP